MKPTDVINTAEAEEVGEHKGALATHLLCIAFHDAKVRHDMRREISLVDDKKIRPGDGWPTFAGNFLALAYGDHIDRQVGKVWREGGPKDYRRLTR